MLLPLTFPKFAAAWLPMLAASVAVDPAPRLADLFVVKLGGFTVPALTCALGAIGVLAARPLARKSETALSWPLFILVSLIMLVVVELWILENGPGALFAFVIAIGLGFSGYALIEMVGEEVRGFLKNIVAGASGKLRASITPKDPQA